MASRSALLEWFWNMVSIERKYADLDEETCHLAIHYYDIVTTVNDNIRSLIISLFIASKYNDIYHLSCKTVQDYTKFEYRDVVNAEALILHTLDFRLQRETLINQANIKNIAVDVPAFREIVNTLNYTTLDIHRKLTSFRRKRQLEVQTIECRKKCRVYDTRPDTRSTTR